jgi:TRAP-type C4-dicarboxylate transport system substrate-binding protein
MYVEAWGGKPVTMSSGELYTAAQRGMVDAGFTSVSTYKSSKLYEVLPGVLEGGFCANANVVVINGDAWSKLTAEEQQMMKDASKPYSNKLFDTMESIDATTLNDLVDKGLIKTNWASPEMRKEWASRVAVKWSEKITESGALGQELLEALKKYELK